MLVHAAAGRGKHVIDGAMEFGDAALADGDGRNDRNSKLMREGFGVELETVAVGEIDHVQRDHGRMPKLDQLEAEAQVIVEVRGVNDDDQGVGLALAFLLAEQDVASHRFVGACRFEAVRTWKVDELDRAAIGQHQPTRVTFDRDARIIADFLAGARQSVEQRALPGIGAAGDGN
jgi:hypothetical protein